MPEKTLPFPRGQTHSDAGIVTMAADTYDHLEGKIFEVEDTVHNTGTKILLRCVRNATGAAITVTRTFVQFGITALDMGRVIDAFAGDCVAGDVSKPIDDGYLVGFSIPSLDLFYVVEAGFCSVLSESSAVSLASGDAVACDTNGRMNGEVAAAGEAVVGTLDLAADTVDTAYVICVHEGVLNSTA